MKLWLDDYRDPKNFGCDDWVWAKTADEAIAILKTGKVEEASLDHDLAYGHYTGEPTTEKTGYDVVCWMEANNIWPPLVRVHSLNPVGRERMRQVIRQHTEIGDRYPGLYQ